MDSPKFPDLGFHGRTPLGKLYLRHMAATGMAAAKGDPDGGAERMLTHMGICTGLTAAAQLLLDAESFEAFKKDVGLDQHNARLHGHFKDAFSELPNL